MSIGALIVGDQATANIARVSAKPISPSKTMINQMTELEKVIGQVPGAKFGDDCTPLKHHFGDGLYIREMLAPKGMLNVSKLHKTTHPYFILEGEFSVQTEDGLVRIKAPYFGITKAGTKRVVFFHENTRWITVHATKETELKKIEDELIAKTYDELPEHVKEQLCLS